MEIKNAEYVGSFPHVGLCPKVDQPEFAFIGRSNVGKSSLINILCGRKELAHTSKKPGKTQMINYFLIDGSWHLVDLPGYGYAHVSKKKRKDWERMIQDYLVKRLPLQCAMVLIDANVPPQKIDVEFLNWLGSMHIPFVIIYTKTDRLKPEELQENIARIQEELLQYWNELPRQFVTSANSGTGKDELLSYIQELVAAALPN